MGVLRHTRATQAGVRKAHHQRTLRTAREKLTDTSAFCSTVPSSHRNLALVRLGRNQKEILESHAFRRCARRQPNALALAEQKRRRIPQLHACQMNAHAGSRACAKRVESCLGIYG